MVFFLCSTKKEKSTIYATESNCDIYFSHILVQKWKYSAKINSILDFFSKVEKISKKNIDFSLFSIIALFRIFLAHYVCVFCIIPSFSKKKRDLFFRFTLETMTRCQFTILWQYGKITKLVGG